MVSYCDIAPGHPFHGPYHDLEYGFPTTCETVLFERLCLEIFQAGLSWELMLKRRAGLNDAFAGFDVDTLAQWTGEDVTRLLGDVRIIRNRRKVEAVLENARRVQRLRQTDGGFAAWIKANSPKTKADWVKTFKARFVFTGPEVVGEFLMSISVLPGAHLESCPAYTRIKDLPNPWVSPLS